MLSELERARFWPKVEKGERCWRWTSATTLGYGVFWRSGAGTRYAHRIAYEELVGPIPDGLTLDHLCRNTVCVNPEHMEPVTRAVNSERNKKVSDPSASLSSDHLNYRTEQP